MCAARGEVIEEVLCLGLVGGEKTGSVTAYWFYWGHAALQNYYSVHTHTPHVLERKRNYYSE